MKPQSAKAKGRNLQKWVVKELLNRFPTLTELDVKSTSMGAGGEDVQLASAAAALFPYCVECKSLSKVAVYNYYEQAKTHGTREPLVIIKQNHSEPLAIVDAKHFLDLVIKANDADMITELEFENNALRARNDRLEAELKRIDDGS